MITSEMKDWAASVVPWVDTCIEQLVLDFMSQPYRHRVEHSLHIQLYNLLLRDERLQRPQRIGASAYHTGLVHKEWPGQTAVVDPASGRGRRQSYDFGILAPASVKAHSLEEFSRGTYEAPIVIELGLDYRLYATKRGERPRIGVAGAACQATVFQSRPTASSRRRR